jgi:hypothetical protein
MSMMALAGHCAAAEHAADGDGWRQNSKNGGQVMGEMRWGVMRE